MNIVNKRWQIINQKADILIEQIAVKLEYYRWSSSLRPSNPEILNLF